MKSYPYPSHRHRGFSLVELMVAMVVGLITLGTVSAIMVNTNKNYTATDSTARLQENARFAMQFIATDLRRAGYFGCTDDISVVNSTLNGSGGAGGLALNALEGVENMGTGTWQEHPMWIDLLRELERGTLAVPSLPAIAHRVAAQLGRDDVNVARVAALIQTEPGLSAKLVKVANSAAMQRSNRCETVHEALTRLGLDSARQLIVAFASERLFQQTDARVRKHSVRIWQHSVDIASLAMVLARLTPPLQPDRALLAGLLHEIGALAILAMAQHHLDLISDEKTLTDMITAATPKVSAHVLKAWGFAAETVQAAQDADNWFRDGGARPDYCDLLIVAHLHALVRQREFAQLPRIDETPAFGKLALGELSPKLSLLVLDEARVQVQEMRALLA